MMPSSTRKRRSCPSRIVSSLIAFPLYVHGSAGWRLRLQLRHQTDVVFDMPIGRDATVVDLIDIGCPEVYTLALSFERSEEHTSELQSLMRISYAVFCLK